MEAIKYEPKFEQDRPLVLQNVKPTAWGDIPTILGSIIKEFNVETNNALEFGVEYGYSTSALANYFKHVTGVDTFIGDVNSNKRKFFFNETKDLLIHWSNIRLIPMDYQTYTGIKENDFKYDLIHIDIIHTYEDTFSCGDWALQHSDVVIFHDTISFQEVYNACRDLSEKHNCAFYNYEESHGLGILVKNK